MKTFYLGYKEPGDLELTEYLNAIEASFNSEEWLKVEANSLEEAKQFYPSEREKWERKQYDKFKTKRK